MLGPGQQSVKLGSVQPIVWPTPEFVTCPLSAGRAYPPMNIFRKGDDIIAIIEVPAVRKSDLDIRVERNTLRISPAARASSTATRWRRTRRAGGLIVPWTLPIDIDADKIRAECRRRHPSAIAARRTRQAVFDRVVVTRNPLPRRKRRRERWLNRRRAIAGKEGARLQGRNDGAGALFRTDDRRC